MKKNYLLKSRHLFVLACLFFTTLFFGQTQTYNSAGANTFTVPAGVTSITVEAWGGGGRGATLSGNNLEGGGGGGGAYVSHTFAVTPGTVYALWVGNGSSSASPGESSWFDSTSYLLAKGGNSSDNSATAAAGGTIAASTAPSGATKYAGGAGKDGSNGSNGNYGGGGGSSAGSLGNGANATNNVGATSSSIGTYGSGGNGATSNGNPGMAGTQPGGGGGGAKTGLFGATQNGGAGGTGRMVVKWTSCPTYAITATSSSTSCANTSATVTLTGLVTGLPVGTYTVTYNLSAPNALTGATAAMTVTTAGTGTFTTATLAATGATVITITKLQSGTTGFGCSSTISTGNTGTLSVTTVPLQPSTITGNTTMCAGTSQMYSVTYVAGVAYNWTFPSGWTQTAGGTSNSITVTVGNTAGNITVTPSNSCGNGTARTLSTTPALAPAQPSAISASGAACVGASVTYSVMNVSGVTYAWVLPSGWTTSGSTINSITVTVGATSGTIQVTPSNSCGAGTPQTLAVSPATAPSQPSTISGATSVCWGASQTYSVTAVGGVTYTWTLPAGWSVTSGAGTHSVAVTVGSGGGTITVTPSSGCGNGTPRTLSVSGTVTPSITATTPGSRVGFGTVTLGATASAGTVYWYTSASGGTPVGSGTSFVTPDLVTTTVFYVEATSGICTSTPRVGVTATVKLPEIALTGNGINIADEDLTPETTDFTDFGTVAVGNNLNRTFTIQNTGTVNLTIDTFTIGGTNAANFTLVTAPAATVAPGGSTTFTLKFTPSSTGIKDATVSFVTNDYDENPFNFSIRGTGGTGLLPEINLKGNNQNIVDGDSGPTVDDHTDFGNVGVGNNVVRTFTIQNTGTGPLLLTGTPFITITGSAYFTVTTQPSSGTIAAGTSLTFQITFAPLATGSYNAIVNIANSDADEPLYDFVISGIGTTSGNEIDIQGNDVSILDGDNTPSFADQTDFGTTDTTTSISIPFFIYNFGSGSSLTVTPTVGISGANAAMFTSTTISNTSGSGVSSIAAGGVAWFVVTFTPNATTGVKTATITINSSDSNEAAYDFAINANIQTPAVLTASPGGIASNLKFWLKADSNIGSTATGSNISSWQEQTTGSSKTARAKTSKEPVFYNEAGYNVNFNPIVHFDGNAAMYGNQGFFNQDFYLVIKPGAPITSASSPQDIYCGDDVLINRTSQDVTGFEMGNTSARYGSNPDLVAYNQGANATYGIAEYSSTKSYSGVNFFNPRKNATTGRMELLCNGATLATTEVATSSYKDISNSRYWLGRSEFFDSSYYGDILEIVGYKTRNNDAGRHKIETYLAIKYGITLGVNGTSLDYLNSAGTIIYGASAGFNYNIAGIGRDDASGLNQKQSKTENTASDITVGLATIEATNSANTNTFLADKDFLVWGSNNATLVAQTPIIVNMSAGIAGLTTEVEFVSVGRIWRVVESGGDVKTVTVSVPATMLTNTINPPGDFYMFISSTPVFNPTAEYRVMKANGSNLFTTYNFDGTKYITFGYAPEHTFVRSIDFDGIDDYLDAGDVVNINGNFTVSAWIKRTAANKVIISKRNTAFTTGYELRINSGGKAQMNWMNGTMQTITSNAVIPPEKWHYLTVAYDGTAATMYIDGVADNTGNLPPVPANSESFLIAAAGTAAQLDYFDGTIDEVRVFGTNLTAAQIRYIMNQEIAQHTDGSVNGTIIPQTISKNEVKTLPWSALKVYYPMSRYTYTNAKDESNNDYTASLRNLTTVDYQTAPLPYQTNADGTFTTATTWKNNTVQDLPCALSIVDGTTTVGWNIVYMDHNVNSPANVVVLGMDLASAKTLKAINDSKIEVSHYLKLNGKIDLVDLSQLVQTYQSDLDVSSGGSIERDQKGTKNIYNYNYWCSPVGAVNSTYNNLSFVLNSCFKDGTDPDNIQNINWVSGYNGSPTSPISLASYWIFTFQNLSDAYANWSYLGPTGSLTPGQGFTLKGSGSASSYQNYTFTGKPNNGQILVPIAANNLNLTGNPYPSALDSMTFINNNSSVIDGTLYFWEHYPTNNSHNLGDYQGGYAARNVLGGVAPVSPPLVSGLGSSTRVPSRFVPVGQGFFVVGSSSGGNIVFDNSVRAFVKESNTASNVMFKSAEDTPALADFDFVNAEDLGEEAAYPTVRLGYTLPNGYHRDILMGFAAGEATSGIDLGFDTVVWDEFPSDMYFLNENQKIWIQGEGAFNAANIYPLSVKTNSANPVSITLDDTENFDDSQDFYIYDAVTGIYHDIKVGPFSISLEPGTYNDRFSLRFTNSALGTETAETALANLNFTMKDNVLNINAHQMVEVKSLQLFNMMGQLIQTWKFGETNREMRIPMKNYASGTYIAKLLTNVGPVSKKIVIR